MRVIKLNKKRKQKKKISEKMYKKRGRGKHKYSKSIKRGTFKKRKKKLISFIESLFQGLDIN